MVTSQGENRPLNILISGAGIAGLAAATTLRRAGHNVQVFEKSSFKSEYGAAVNMAPNANGLLREMGMQLEAIGAVTAGKLNEYGADSVKFRETDVSGMAEKYGNPWQYVHRIDLHNALKELATSAEGEGTPATVRLAATVVAVDTETATLTLKDGEKIQGDLVVVADGVNSALRDTIDHSGAKPVPFGRSTYRFLLPASILRTDPLTERYVSGGLEIISGGKNKLVFYPCRGGELLNVVCIIADDAPHEKKGWSGPQLKEEILRQIEGWHQSIVAVVEKVDGNSVGFWPLYDMPTLETWVKGKAVIIGDAAHPFLPYQGQGAAQAIEDAVTLQELLPLQQTTPEDIAERLKLYQTARFERATFMQEGSRAIGKEDEQAAKTDGLAFKFIDYAFSHKARSHAAGILQKSLSA